jgi:hypothetical protein
MKTIEELTESVKQAWEAERVEVREINAGDWRHCVTVVGGKSLYYQACARSTVFPAATIEDACAYALDAAPNESLAELKERFARDWEKRA